MPAPVDLVVGIAERVDDLRLRSESARVLVNAVRTLFGPATHSSTTTAREDAVGAAQKRLSRTDVVGTVAELVRNSSQHPMLVNEGMVAIALLASQNSSTGKAVSDHPRACFSLTPDQPCDSLFGTRQSPRFAGAARSAYRRRRRFRTTLA